MSRRLKIEQMLEEDPQDVFLRYSLAIELNNEGEFTEAIRILGELAGETPPYVPAFFRSAQIHAAQDNVDAARTALRSGIEEARRQGDMHAAAEMSEMLAELGQLGE